MGVTGRKGKMVVVTGIGLVIPTGVGSEGLLKALQKGESSASELLDRIFASYPVKYACQVKDFNPTDFLSYKVARRMTRCSLFGVIAAKLAVENSGLNVLEVDPQRLEIYEGTSIGGMDRIFLDHQNFLLSGYEKLRPHTPVLGFVGSTSGEIGIVLGLKSRSITVCSGSASASDAIGLGFERIASGMIDVAIVGGSEAPILAPIIASFCRTGVISTRNSDAKTACRPFALDRDGFILGEGGAFIVLESKEHAELRGAKIYAELAGFGNSCDAYDMISPHPEGEGILAATRRALQSAEASIEDVDYINAHGTGTKINDKCETLAFKKIFGARALKVPISSTKPITGHLLGACGAVEAVICILAIRESFVPPTINYFSPDLECDLDYVPNVLRHKAVSFALSYTYGFGGKNSVLAFRRY